MLGDSEAAEVSLERPAAAEKLHKRRRAKPRICGSFKFAISAEKVADFELVPKLIGRNGTNMKKIAQRCNGKLRIRGRGSGYCEGPERREVDLPLQLALSCPSAEDLSLGKQLVLGLLDQLASLYAQYCHLAKIEPPTRFYTTLFP